MWSLTSVVTTIFATMIISKPKTSTLISVGIFLAGILAASVWIGIELIKNPAVFFWIKLVLLPVLLVIALVVAIKTYQGAVTLQLGNNRLTYQMPGGSLHQFPISDLQNWHEEVIQRKKTKYSRLTIRLKNGKELHLSNQENSAYDQVINYLRKKAKRSSPIS